MYLIVGLGNPGGKYEKTRHNIGFDAIDALADSNNVKIDKQKFKGLCSEIRINNEKVILLKPLTYMNLSGESVILAKNYYDIPNENIIVLHDDISLDVGKIRIRTKGSSGGQNGIKNIIDNLADDNFNRVKIGVGMPEKNLVDYVLGRFSKEDRTIVDETIKIVVKATESIVSDGVVNAMNQFNGIRVE